MPEKADKKAWQESLAKTAGWIFMGFLAIHLFQTWQTVAKLDDRIFILCFGNPKCEARMWKEAGKQACGRGGVNPSVRILLALKNVTLPPCPEPPKARLNSHPADTLPNELADIERMVVTACLSMTEADNIDGFLSCERRLWKKAINDACRTSPRWCKDYQAAGKRRRKGGAF